jgi:formylglycine-generating enzyme required for sulfatase activity
MTKLTSAMLGTALVAVGALAPWWWPFLLGLTGDHSSEIGGLASLVQLVLWIGAGTALIFRQFRERRPPLDLTRETNRYMDYLVEHHSWLHLRGMGVPDRVTPLLKLLEVYIPLKARRQAPQGETLARERRVVSHHCASSEELDDIDGRLGEAVSILDLLRSHDGLIILGSPGSGKTTFLKFLALTFASGQGNKLGIGSRIPILLPLAAYATALDKADVPLDHFVAHHYQKERGLNVPFDAILQAGLEQGNVLFLLDGLDEVGKLGHLVVERVRDSYSLYCKKGNKFVMTSRDVGYREVLPKTEGFAECVLVDFTNEEITAFIDKWTAALGRMMTDREAEYEREGLLTSVYANSGVRPLATNPLSLTILALININRQGVVLPQRRIELLNIYIKTILNDWNWVRSLTGRPVRGAVHRYGEPHSGCGDLDLTEKTEILATLALWVHEHSPNGGLVKEMDLRRELEQIYRDRGHSHPEALAPQFFDDLLYFNFIIPRGDRQYSFTHGVFQEYLAAVALAQWAKQNVAAVVDALEPHVGETRWTDVVLLTVAYIAIVEQWKGLASELLEEFLRRSPGPPGEAAVLAGRSVANAGVSEVTERCRHTVVAALLDTMKAASRVIAPRRAAAGRALAEVGEPRPEITKIDHMEFCRVLARSFWMGSGDEDYQALESEKPRHKVDLPYDFQIGRYPVTVAQFREYVEATGIKVGDMDSLTGPINSPVAWVSWPEAVSFCHWLTYSWQEKGILEQGWMARLPSEAEWEKAARGVDGRIYPWGNGFDKEKANTGESMIVDVTGESKDNVISAVGCFPNGASVFGCEEMSGNVWEWTRSLWGANSRSPKFCYPYAPADGREDLNASGEVLRVLRGGSCLYVSKFSRCASRIGLKPGDRSGLVGFRIVLSPFLNDSLFETTVDRR